MRARALSITSTGDKSRPRRSRRNSVAESCRPGPERRRRERPISEGEWGGRVERKDHECHRSIVSAFLETIGCGMILSFRDLVVWKRAIALVVETYRISR